MTVTRTYNSPLREEQMEQTREKLLDQVAEMLASESLDEVTVAAVAERAKVSVRTAYRYFPTKEALIDGFNQWMGKRFGTPKLPDSLDEIPAMTEALFRSFDTNERLLRASRRSGAGAEIRKRRKAEQVRVVSKAVAKAAPHLDESEVRKIGAVIHALTGSELWLGMRDTWGLSTEEAIEASKWGMAAIVAKLEGTRKGRK